MFCLADTIVRSKKWTITKSLLSRLDAFDMWIYRSVLKISCRPTGKIINDDVLRRMGTNREITIICIGHTIKNHNTSQIQQISGKIKVEDPVDGR